MKTQAFILDYLRPTVLLTVVGVKVLQQKPTNDSIKNISRLLSYTFNYRAVILILSRFIGPIHKFYNILKKLFGVYLMIINFNIGVKHILYKIPVSTQLMKLRGRHHGISLIVCFFQQIEFINKQLIKCNKNEKEVLRF